MDIQELKLTLSDLNERLNDIKINVYKIDSKKTRLQEIESQLSQEKVWSNLELSQKLSKVFYKNLLVSVSPKEIN